MGNNSYIGKQHLEEISGVTTDYYNLCSILKRQKLFKAMMVDVEKPDLCPDEIRELYYRYIEEYMCKVYEESVHKHDSVNAFYFSAVTVVYLCYNIYPGWGNNDYNDGHYIEIDELIEYLYCFSRNNVKDIIISKDILKILCKLMYSITQHNYIDEFNKKIHELDKFKDIWVVTFTKLICLNEAFHDGEYLEALKQEEGCEDEYDAFHKYINSIPKSLKAYLLKFSDYLANNQFNQGYHGNCMVSVSDIHVIPMLLPYTDYPESCDYEKYMELRTRSQTI